MRDITDDAGTRWTVTVGRESYGMQVLLFFPAGGVGVRKTPMMSDTRLDAARELADLGDDELREALERSTRWEDDSGLPGR